MDPIGFGLENYDSQGRYRSTQFWKPKAKAKPEEADVWELVKAGTSGATQCSIAGQGEIAGVGTFKGPAQLEDLLLKSPRLNRCVAGRG
jgi:hypothetical protein